MAETIYIAPAVMKEKFYSILMKHGFAENSALQCAEIFTNNSVDGVYTHGVYRFPRFVQNIAEGYVKPQQLPTLKNKSGAIEQWDGNLGPGPLNAIHATETAIQLAQQHGIGCVALANTNHWMRGGTYGWHAAKKGFVFIGWTNTIANMPPWGSAEKKLGNNPLVIALPYKDEAIVLDMAMSQYSFGAMELAQMKNESFPVFGGYSSAGELTKDPAAILQSKRPLPIGYWKGAGLSLLLDILATILSGGLSTSEISSQSVEYGLSQVFIIIDTSRLAAHSSIPAIVQNIIDDYQSAQTTSESSSISYPGQRVLQTRRINSDRGIPVVLEFWDKILQL